MVSSRAVVPGERRDVRGELVRKRLRDGETEGGRDAKRQGQEKLVSSSAAAN